jgi:hypothetical protein
MNMTVEAAYEYVADENLESLEQDVEQVNVQLKKLNVYTK